MADLLLSTVNDPTSSFPTTIGDLDLRTGDLQIATGVTAIRQQLMDRLTLFKGDWFLDVDVGMPYYQQVLVKNPNLGVVRALFAQAVRTTPGVSELLSLSLELDARSRSLQVNFTCVTDTDEVLVFNERFVLAIGGDT